MIDNLIRSYDKNFNYSIVFSSNVTKYDYYQKHQFSNEKKKGGCLLINESTNYLSFGEQGLKQLVSTFDVSDTMYDQSIIEKYSNKQVLWAFFFYFPKCLSNRISH